MTFRVLVVEDEAVAAEAHASYLGRLPAFQLAGVARSAREATRFLTQDPDVDLVLLDMHLPDGHGLTLLRHLRAAGQLCDVIAVTSARDLEVVRQAVTHGVVSYLLKPFSFAAFRSKLEQYAAYRERLAGQGSGLAQAEIDAVLGLLRPTEAQELPKGLSLSTLTLISSCLRAGTGVPGGSGGSSPAGSPSGLSASEVAQQAGTSRVTARRYLEHLVDARLVARETRFGGSGRPEVEYQWRGSAGIA